MRAGRSAGSISPRNRRAGPALGACPTGRPRRGRRRRPDRRNGLRRRRTWPRRTGSSTAGMLPSPPIRAGRPPLHLTSPMKYPSACSDFDGGRAAVHEHSNPDRTYHTLPGGQSPPQAGRLMLDRPACEPIASIAIARWIERPARTRFGLARSLIRAPGDQSKTDRVYLELDIILGISTKLRIQLNERSKRA